MTKVCDLCGVDIDYLEGIGWTHLDLHHMRPHRPIPVDDECVHGVQIVDFGDCDQCVQDLAGDLAQLEREDPAVAKAAKNLRDLLGE